MAKTISDQELIDETYKALKSANAFIRLLRDRGYKININIDAKENGDIYMEVFTKKYPTNTAYDFNPSLGLESSLRE